MTRIELIIGICILMFSLIDMRAIKKSLKLLSTHQQKVLIYHFYVYQALICLFVIGYFIILLCISYDKNIFNENIFSLILLFGSIFVFMSKTLHIQILKKINKAVEYFLPVCCVCKKVRHDDSKPKEMSSWGTSDEYLKSKKEFKYSHTYCPECAKKVMG